MHHLPQPSQFQPSLTDEILRTVAGWLLEEQRATDEDLQRPTDNSYSRGCTAFARQKSRIVQEFSTGAYPWLSVINGKSNDLVFLLGAGVPCRFAADDPSQPKKTAVLTTHEFQMEFAGFDRPAGEPVRFCFVIDRGHSEEHEVRVFLLGYDALDQVACGWESDPIRRIFRVADDEQQPQPVQLDKPRVTPKRRSDDIERDGTAPTGGE